MKNFCLKIEYDGTRYRGWQKQKNTENTIQQKIENVLFEMTGKKTEIFASGRTDAGVHALAQVANFKTDFDTDCGKVIEYLNRYLPHDIRVTDICEADGRFHSRLCASRKTYQYRICFSKPSVFERKYVYFYDKPDTFDINAAKSAAEKICGTHDFAPFSSLGKTKKSTVRTVYSIDIKQTDSCVDFTVCGDGFLYNMVRIICGTLLEIGVSKKSPEDIGNIFLRNRSCAGVTLPACGLTLLNVEYENKHIF